MPTDGMVQIPAGEFLMGSEEFYPEERPVRRVAVEGFWMDEHAVTAADFRRFVRETGYVTLAERPLDPADYPDADPDLLVPGALVFRQDGTARCRSTTIATGGSTCPAPTGSVPAGPVRRSTDATATRSSRSPSRTPRPTPPGRARSSRPRPSGSTQPAAASRDSPSRGATSTSPTEQPAANTWQGEFPWQNLKLDGHEGTSPVGSFEPNGYGLYDMTGNVWEWTTDFFTAGHDPDAPACCAPSVLPGETFPRRVIKGGSHLCAPNYCLRYRPAARQGEAVDTATGHIGFRCIVRG